MIQSMFFWKALIATRLVTFLNSGTYIQKNVSLNTDCVKAVDNRIRSSSNLALQILCLEFYVYLSKELCTIDAKYTYSFPS